MRLIRLVGEAAWSQRSEMSDKHCLCLVSSSCFLEVVGLWGSSATVGAQQLCEEQIVDRC